MSSQQQQYNSSKPQQQQLQYSSAINTQSSSGQSKGLSESNPTSAQISENQKWQQLIEENENQDDKIPFLMQQSSFKTQNPSQQFTRQKSMMQQTAKKGKQLLINKNYMEASKQLSKTLMTFEFIVKNHVQTIPKQEIKNMMIDTVLPSYNNLALCYLKLKNYQLVVSFTNQVLAQDDANVKARYRRALAYKQMKNTDQAINDFQIVKKLDKEMEEDCNNLIKECKQIEIEARKKRKLAAQKFISGYQSDDIKVNKTHESESLRTNDSQKQLNPANLPQNKPNILSWIRQKCQNCSSLLSRLRPSKPLPSKQE